MTPLVRALLGAVIGAGLVAALGFGLSREARVLPAVAVGKSAPPFELEALDGRTVSSLELRGRPAVINFWASWCIECRKEHPLLMAAHDRYGDRIAFVGVVFQDSTKNARGYLVEMGDRATGSYANLLDPGSRVAIDYGVYGVPETFFVDRQGTIVAKRVGRVTPELLASELERLLRS
jgi:cytochrome c biogenesis protein CcmG/thiol:disulfide interchange protein DsbE